MNLVKEAYKILSSDAFKSILLVIQMVGFIVLFNISIGTVNTANILSNKVENTNLKNAYYYSYGPGGVQDVSNNKDFKDVTFLNYFCPLYNDVVVTAYCYTEDFLQENQLEISNGSKIDNLSKNECLVSYDLAKKMNLKNGDTIHLSCDESTIRLFVKGILHKDEQIIKFTVAGSDLNLKTIYEKPKDTIILVSCDTVPSQSIKSLPCGIYKNTNELEKIEIETIFNKYGEIASFESMLKEEQEENKSIVMLFNSFTTVLFFITFINVMANNFLILRFQEKRFGIYFLCGMSFDGVVKIIFLRNLLLVGISSFVGVSVLSYIWNYSLIDEFSFNISSVAYSLMIVIMLTLVSEIPIYLKMKRTEPIRFFEEGLE